MVSAVISEFNPFHNGHSYLTDTARSLTGSDIMLTIMSGNFVQRGEPAIFDKYTRAKAALMSGYDICLEIPVYAVLSSAQLYAFNAVKILDSLGIVDNLCFGCESGDIGLLKEIAFILSNEPQEYKELLKYNISTGKSYAAGVSLALTEYTGEKRYADALNSPNNILAVEYIKALYSLKSNIKPVAIKRTGAAHDSLIINDDNICSASMIRKMIHDKNLSYINYVSKGCLNVIKNRAITPVNDSFATQIANTFNYLRIIKDEDYFSGINECNSFISHKIKKLPLGIASYDELIKNIKSKDNTYTRISRIVLSSILEITKENIESFSKHKPYTRLLGIRKNHSGILRNYSKEKIDVITKWSSYKSYKCILEDNDDSIIKKELQANDLYYDFSGSTAREITKNVIVV